TNEARLANDEELDGMIADAIKKMNLDECLGLFRSKGVTLGPVYDAPQLLSDRHVVGRECYIALEADQGAAVMHNVTLRLSRTPGSIRRPAPGLGQHTGELLKEAGIGDAEIRAMQKRGAIRCL